MFNALAEAVKGEERAAIEPDSPRAILHSIHRDKSVRGGKTTLKRLEKDLIRDLNLTHIRPDPTGVLCDGFTGEPIVFHGTNCVTIEETIIEVISEAFYRVTCSDRLVFLKYTKNAWYYGVKE